MDNKLSTALAKKFAESTRETIEKTTSDLKDNIFKKLKADTPRNTAVTPEQVVSPLVSSFTSYISKNNKVIDKKLGNLDKKYSDSIKSLDNVYQLKFDDYDKKYLKIKRAFTDLGVDLDKVTPGHLTYNESLKRTNKPSNDNYKVNAIDRFTIGMPITNAIVKTATTILKTLLSGAELGLGALGVAGIGGLLSGPVGLGLLGIAGVGGLAYGAKKLDEIGFGTPQEKADRLAIWRAQNGGKQWGRFGPGFNNQSGRLPPISPSPETSPIEKTKPAAPAAAEPPTKKDYSDVINYKVADYSIDSMNDYIVIAKKKVSLKGHELFLDFDKITIKSLPTTNNSPLKSTIPETRSRSPDPNKPSEPLKKGDATDQDEDLKNYEQNNGFSGGSVYPDSNPGGLGNYSGGSSTENVTNPAITQAPPVVGVNPTGDAGIHGSIQSPGSKEEQQASSSAQTSKGGSPYLAQQRQKYFEELDKDPALKDEVMRAIRAENGRSANSMADVLESLANRSVMYKYPSFRTGLHDGFYGPINDGRPSFTRPLSKEELERGEEALNLVRGGSNRIELRTDQGMLSDPGSREYLQMPDRSGWKIVDGENYFYKGVGTDNRGRDFYNTQSKAMAEYDAQHQSDTGNLPQEISGGVKADSTEWWNQSRDKGLYKGSFDSSNARANFMQPGEQFGMPGQHLVTVTTEGGHKFVVNRDSAPAFKGVIEDLEKAGMPLGSIGGYSPRPGGIAGSGKMSQHSMGNAMDIGSQSDRNVINRDTRKWIDDHPDEWKSITSRWGMVDGGAWRGGLGPDLGHIEWSGKTPWIDEQKQAQQQKEAQAKEGGSISDNASETQAIIKQTEADNTAILKSVENPFLKHKFDSDNVGAQAQRAEDETLSEQGDARNNDTSARRIELRQATNSADDLKPKDTTPVEDVKNTPQLAPKQAEDPKSQMATPKDNLERPIHDPEKEAPSPGSDGYGRGNQGNSDSIN